jgi:hypothetical protein
MAVNVLPSTDHVTFSPATLPPCPHAFCWKGSSHGSWHVTPARMTANAAIRFFMALSFVETLGGAGPGASLTRILGEVCAMPVQETISECRGPGRGKASRADTLEKKARAVRS